jgi:ferredoxin
VIVAEQKSLAEMKVLIGDSETVLVVGCGTCVTVCFAGGAREAAIVAASLRMSTILDNQAKRVTDVTVQRQCEYEYLEPITGQVKNVEVVLSLGCGIGVQAIVEHFPDAWVVPGLNTTFLGMPLEQGVWAERCAACGDCILGLTGGICPIARCAKSLLNGPCGGSENGHCEISPDIPCAWQLICERLTSQGKLHLLIELQPPKNWKVSRDGGPRKIIRPDLQLASDLTSEGLSHNEHN